VSYKTSYRRVQRSQEALDAPRLQLESPVEIDEFYVKAGLKGRERETSRRASDAYLSPYRGVSKDRLTPYFRAFQLRHEVFSAN
jgi:transposase-like protein